MFCPIAISPMAVAAVRMLEMLKPDRYRSLPGAIAAARATITTSSSTVGA